MATQATDDELEELAALLEGMATQATSWRILHRLGLSEKQREISKLERRSKHIQTFQPTMVPGLLQVADYARRVIEMGYLAEQTDVGGAVNTRMQRQAILYDSTKRFDFLVTEAALRWRPPSFDMRPQLDRLTSVASLPNVTLSIVPLGEGSLPLLHPFVVWELETETLISVETYGAELWVRETHDLSRYRQVWERLSEAARPASDVLRRLMRDLSEGQGE